MKRSGLVTGVTVMQLLLGLLLVGVSILLLFLIRSPEMRKAPESAAAVWGLEVAVAVIAPIALLAVVGAYGMWKNKLWGWWLALLINLGFFLMFMAGMASDGWNNVDKELIPLTAASLVPVILLLIPSVRRFYWGRPDSHFAQPVAVDKPSAQQ